MVITPPAPDPQVTVSIDFNDGNGSQQVLQADAPTPVPETYKFGFAASTGLFTDTHLIRNVAIGTERPLPPRLNLVKQVVQPLPGDLTAGSQVPYEFVVTNAGGTTIDDLAVDDPKTGPVSCPVTSLAPGETVTCTATYTVTPADVANGSIDNTATASGTSGGDPVTSPPSSETVPIQLAPDISVEKRVETPPGPYAVGQTVTYAYTVRNTGGVELADVAVRDDHVTGITCASTTLAPPAGQAGDSTRAPAPTRSPRRRQCRFRDQHRHGHRYGERADRHLAGDVPDHPPRRSAPPPHAAQEGRLQGPPLPARVRGPLRVHGHQHRQHRAARRACGGQPGRRGGL
ncbi:hypothetical protein GTV15_18370 [Streptomyces sp. SID7803]|nr:hypothetical protein [Streptomyces sp. SID7803]